MTAERSREDGSYFRLIWPCLRFHSEGIFSLLEHPLVGAEDYVLTLTPFRPTSSHLTPHEITSLSSYSSPTHFAYRCKTRAILAGTRTQESMLLLLWYKTYRPLLRASSGA